MKQYFPDTLKKLRMEKGLSQQALADKMYVTRSTVARWENGYRLPDAVMLSRLAEVLGADANVLLSAAAQSSERPNVIMVDDRKLILTGGLPVLEEVFPHANVTGFTDPSEAVAAHRGVPNRSTILTDIVFNVPRVFVRRVLDCNGLVGRLLAIRISGRIFRFG